MTMKKLLFLFCLSALFACEPVLAQTSIIGNSQCSSPYNGSQPIKIQRAGVPPGEWVEAVAPTNIVITGLNGTEITTQVIGWMQATSTGIVTWDFNASLTDPVVSATIANGWVLPAGTYQITTKFFSDKTGASIQSVNFQIVGPATAAVTAAIRNKGKK